MFNLGILDVAIGLIVIYLQLSLVCTALNELLAAVLQRRARNLWKGVRDLLSDPEGTGTAQKLYDHPFIKALHRNQSKPTYIPSRTFALALLDVVTSDTNGQPGEANRLATLRTWAAGIPNDELRKSLLILIDDAAGNLARTRDNIELWFNNSMDQVSGWYKQRTQWITLIFAVVVTVVANVDTALVANSLARDPAARNALVAVAPELARQAPTPTPPAEAGGATGTTAPETSLGEDIKATEQKIDVIMERIQNVGLPIGWDSPEEDKKGVDPWPGWCLKEWGHQLGLHFFGWLLTALAVSLGSPFWFDILNKFIVIRSTVKPAEKSGKQPSKDEPAPDVEKQSRTQTGSPGDQAAESKEK